MEGLLDVGSEMLRESGDPYVIDAGIMARAVFLIGLDFLALLPDAENKRHFHSSTLNGRAQWVGSSIRHVGSKARA